MKRGLAVIAAMAFFLATPTVRSENPAPLRKAPMPSDRPLAQGPGVFVDAARGNDQADGTLERPWKTIAHALRTIRPGVTVYLRGGVYFENVVIARAGERAGPITIRSYPKEQAVIDAGWREFSESPARSWEPVAGGAPGEYRSTGRYPNIRDVVGSLGDSMIGLQTYYHAKDFRATNELMDWEDWSKQDQTDLKPLWCGPGLWFDRDTGHIHARLARTNLPAPAANYRGEIDPRRLPLVIAPFHAVALHVDGGRHLRFQDLVIRGGGYTSILLDHADDVEFDNVTVWCGTYGIRAARTTGLRFLNSALYGNVAPWTFRGDGSKRDYPGRPHRNISRLNTHALLEIDSGRESSVYATPQNDHWEFAWSEFTDAHDGLYLGGINVRFHHNLIDGLQDDGIYLSPMYARHRLDKKDPEIHIFQNEFRTMLTALAFGGTEPETRDKVFVYRNVFDLRGQVPTGRSTARRAEPVFSGGKVIGDHGSPPWAAMNIYHNTFIAGGSRYSDMATFAGTKAANPRRVFNNIYWHIDRLPAHTGPNPDLNAAADGNLYWSTGAGNATYFRKLLGSEQFTKSKGIYPAGSESHSKVADPQLAKNYRPEKGSAAIDSGVPLPADWPDPLRTSDTGRPDIGAMPFGVKSWRVGRGSRD